MRVGRYNVLQLAHESKERLLGGVKGNLVSICPPGPWISSISRSTVVVAHTAVLYFCFDQNVIPIIVDPKSWDDASAACREQLRQGLEKEVTRLFAVEWQDHAAIEAIARKFNCKPVFLDLNDLREARQIFMSEILKGKSERLEEKEEEEYLRRNSPNQGGVKDGGLRGT